MPHAQWDNVMPVIVHDNRYQALTSLPQRKEAFERWSAAKIESEREAKRMALKQQEENFLAMLEECDAIEYGDSDLIRDTRG